MIFHLFDSMFLTEIFRLCVLCALCGELIWYAPGLLAKHPGCNQRQQISYGPKLLNIFRDNSRATIDWVTQLKGCRTVLSQVRAQSE